MAKSKGSQMLNSDDIGYWETVDNTEVTQLFTDERITKKTITVPGFHTLQDLETETMV